MHGYWTASRTVARGFGSPELDADPHESAVGFYGCILALRPHTVWQALIMITATEHCAGHFPATASGHSPPDGGGPG